MIKKILELVGNSKKKTSALIITSIIGLIGWDIYVASNETKGDTISEILLKFSEINPSFAAAFGILCGHLFWSRNKTLSSGTNKLRLIGLVGTAGGLILADFMNILPQTNPIIYLLGGVIAGKLFWSQKTKKE